MADKTKILTKVQSFDDVQKSLQDIETKLNELNLATNTESEGEVADKDGKPGDIRITKGANKNYTFEINTEEGWKFGSVGSSPITFTDKPAEFSKPDAVVDKFKDDLGNPKNLPAPDYDSGYFEAATNKIYVTGATDGVNPSTFYLYDDASQVVGIPPLGFTLLSEPSYIQVITAPHNVKSFDDAMSAGILILDWQNQYYSTGNAMGVRCYITSPEHIAFPTADNYLYYSTNSGGALIKTDDSNFHDAFDSNGTADNNMLRIKIWK